MSLLLSARPVFTCSFFMSVTQNLTLTLGICHTMHMIIVHVFASVILFILPSVHFSSCVGVRHINYMLIFHVIVSVISVFFVHPRTKYTHKILKRKYIIINVFMFVLLLVANQLHLMPHTAAVNGMTHELMLQ